MGSKEGKRTRAGQRRRPVRYFYLDDELYKVLWINRPGDLIIAWNYKEGKRMAYVWSDVRKRMGRAFPVGEVSKMINRHVVNIEKYILEGKIRAPQRLYSMDEKRTPGKYMFSEKDVLGLHDYLLTVHYGRPRKDGRITPGKMPSRAELKAMMQHDTMVYVKTSDGEFAPVWKEVDW